MSEGSKKVARRLMIYCRARITKDEPLRYISHLDYASLMQRAIRRARIPAAYSEGFNPHMKLSFASALSVGVTSDAEYMDLELSETMAKDEIAKRLRPALPDGVRLMDLRVMRGKPKALMSLTDGAVYEISVPLCGAFSEAQAAIDAFNATKECMYLRKTPKKTREIEIRQYICGELQAEAAENDMLRLKMAIRITPGGSVKPQEILNVLCEKFALPVRAETALVHRGALLCEGKDLLSAGEVRQ